MDPLRNNMIDVALRRGGIDPRKQALDETITTVLAPQMIAALLAVRGPAGAADAVSGAEKTASPPTCHCCHH